MSVHDDKLVEVNFDGLVGPSHNYAGLSFGNVASFGNAGSEARPRAAALQGLAKMRRMLDLGLRQGILLPHDRPNVSWLRTLGFGGDDEAVCAAAMTEEPAAFVAALSASAMWTANAGTVSPAADTIDGRCHITVSNLSAMPHRSGEQAQTARQLRLAFGDARHFAVHDALPAAFGDEGAANAMRVSRDARAAGLEMFVYGDVVAGDFPARQSRIASAAVARRHGLRPGGTLLIRQDPAAIAAGAFHNDVVAVANGHVLFAHEQAFADRDAVHASIRARLPEVVIVEAPAARVALESVIRSYVFNSQLVTLPNGGMALILPAEVRDTPDVWAWLQDVQRGDNPIELLEVVEVRESMRNGGGPACLRLRVPMGAAALASVDGRFLLDQAKCDGLARVIERVWPESIAPADLRSPDLWRQCREARRVLLAHLGFAPNEL